jgi:hypothetical protein
MEFPQKLLGRESCLPLHLTDPRTFVIYKNFLIKQGWFNSPISLSRFWVVGFFGVALF